MLHDIDINILNQLMGNKYSGFNTVFIKDVEYKVLDKINNKIKIQIV